MKPNLLNAKMLALALAMPIIALHACKKEHKPVVLPLKSSEVLYDKPLETVKGYIAGKWQYVRAEGGFGGGQETIVNTFVAFEPGDVMTKTVNGKKEFSENYT